MPKAGAISRRPGFVRRPFEGNHRARTHGLSGSGGAIHPGQRLGQGQGRLNTGKIPSIREVFISLLASITK